LDRVLVGRMAGVRLGELGRSQARSLALSFARERITAVQSSPRERAWETAAPIAERAGLPFAIIDALDEIDVGEWTGQPFTVLNDDVRWVRWNARRASNRPPRGETMHELELRVMQHLRGLHAAHPSGRIVLVSHAEVIRAAILHCLKMSFDDFARIDVAPATISTLALDHRGARVVDLNQKVTP
jgi:probable phosphoglycerate mutase